MGTGQPNVNATSLKSLIIPLPPLAEQKRIVEKCDRLMSLCDEIEKQHKQKQDSIVRMNESAIAQLLSSQNPDDFRHHWERICNNFDLLYSVPETIPKLRQAILQLAVMGKLVRQDPNDEPAAVLLERIKEEREDLISKGELKKEKLLPSVYHDEVLHPIPYNWVWTRLGEVVNYSGSRKFSPDEIHKDSWLLDLEDIEKDTSRIISKKTFAEKKSKSTKAQFKRGDVLYGKLRPYLNKVVVADSEGFCTTEIVPLQPYKGVISEYIQYVLKRPDFLNYVNSKTYGINLPRLGTEDGRRAIFPLPPLAEQKRIVEKCDRLMSLCDRLEAKLKQGRESREKLMEVAAKQVLLN